MTAAIHMIMSTPSYPPPPPPPINTPPHHGCPHVYYSGGWRGRKSGRAGAGGRRHRAPRERIGCRLTRQEGQAEGAHKATGETIFLAWYCFGTGYGGVGWHGMGWGREGWEHPPPPSSFRNSNNNLQYFSHTLTLYSPPPPRALPPLLWVENLTRFCFFAWAGVDL